MIFSKRAKKLKRDPGAGETARKKTTIVGQRRLEADRRLTPSSDPPLLCSPDAHGVAVSLKEAAGDAASSSNPTSSSNSTDQIKARAGEVLVKDDEAVAPVGGPIPETSVDDKVVVMGGPEDKWQAGERILCFHGPLIYEAKIQQVIRVRNRYPVLRVRII